MIHKALLPSDVYSVVRYFEETGQVKDKEVVNLKKPKLNKTKHHLQQLNSSFLMSFKMPTTTPESYLKKRAAKES